MLRTVCKGERSLDSRKGGQPAHEERSTVTSNGHRRHDIYYRQERRLRSYRSENGEWKEGIESPFMVLSISIEHRTPECVKGSE